MSKFKLGVCADCECEEYGRKLDGEHICIECADSYGWNTQGYDLDAIREESHSDADPGL